MSFDPSSASTQPPGQPTGGRAIATSLWTYRIMHAALMASVLVYGVVVEVIAAGVEELPPEPDRLIMGAIAVVAAVIVGLVLPFARLRLLPPAKPLAMGPTGSR